MVESGISECDTQYQVTRWSQQQYHMFTSPVEYAVPTRVPSAEKLMHSTEPTMCTMHAYKYTIINWQVPGTTAHTHCFQGDSDPPLFPKTMRRKRRMSFAPFWLIAASVSWLICLLFLDDLLCAPFSGLRSMNDIVILGKSVSRKLLAALATRRMPRSKANSS